MEETLVTIETAILAKEKGFNWICDNGWIKGMFTNGIDKLYHSECYFDNSGIHISAPTQSLLQKWLREEHYIHITITSISQESWQYHITKPGDTLDVNWNEDYESFEEALEDGLLEALKLIK